MKTIIVLSVLLLSAIAVTTGTTITTQIQPAYSQASVCGSFGVQLNVCNQAEIRHLQIAAIPLSLQHVLPATSLVKLSVRRLATCMTLWSAGSAWYYVFRKAAITPQIIRQPISILHPFIFHSTCSCTYDYCKIRIEIFLMTEPLDC
jgi:hypothetical protein